MPELNQHTILYAPRLAVLPRPRWTFWVDAEAPNWIATDERGTWLLDLLQRSPADFATIASRYGAQFGTDSGKAWVHAHSFISEALRHGLLSLSPIERPVYRGRAHYLTTNRLRECWLHTNNSCNLTCHHCLVSSSPRGERGLPLATLKALVDQAVGLGVERFYLTGGEPFVRADLPELIAHITETCEREAIILTNATLVGAGRGAILAHLDRARVKFQVSIDGSTSQINDPIRGAGSFAATASGVRALRRRGFDVTLTTVVVSRNLEDLPNLTRLAASCGVGSQHLMWVHRRGRITEPQHAARSTQHTRAPQSAEWCPSAEELIEAVRTVKREADQHGVILDNAASSELRANAPAGIKFDLGNAGWQSLCLYADGHVYPSAAFANHKPLDCGNAANGTDLASIWRQAPVLEQIRQATVVRKQQAAADPLRYLTGGGDIEHSYFFSGDFLGDDPYYDVSRTLLLDAMDALTARKAALVNRRSGFDAPRIFHAMGDGAVVCGTTEFGREDVEVAFLHSNCVLSFDVEKPRKIVQQFYGQAAELPQAELCCPTKYDEEAVCHIPKDVLDRFYGCGSPSTAANPQPGETYVDLGCGAGIDCFIAAKCVGSTGRVIGIDMTDQMLAVARDSQQQVAAALGFDVVEFRKGFLEAIPVEDKTADVVTSNCVINLSPDKPKVFAELWRILTDHGRIVIADIVSDREVPPRLKVNERLWGECIVGALTEEQFLAMLEQAGFYGLSVLKKTFWKEIEGFRFFSVTVQGFKFEKTAGCTYIGQYAVYRGPFQATMDEEGHLFPRNVAIAVCTDTAAKLSRPPYAGCFTLVEADGRATAPALAASADAACCAPGAHGCC